MPFVDGCCIMQDTVGDRTNVWARELHDGSHALVFLNAGSSQASVTCDAACFAAIGVDPARNYTVDDLWNDVPQGTITNATFTAVDLPADGGHLMIRVAEASM